MHLGQDGTGRDVPLPSGLRLKLGPARRAPGASRALQAADEMWFRRGGPLPS